MPEAVHVTLTSPSGTPIKTLVESALRSELKMINLTLERIERNLTVFEQKYQISTPEFYRRLTEDELQETLDFIEWVGEYKTYLNLQQKQRTLQEIEIAG